MFGKKLSKQLLLVWTLVLAFAVTNVQAMQMDRPFPEGIKRGKMSTTALADIVIDGKLRLLSVALKIYNEDNLIVTSGTLDVRNIVVYYLENDVGEILKIWILTAEEAKRPFPPRAN
jgi:hypothetical protein